MLSTWTPEPDRSKFEFWTLHLPSSDLNQVILIEDYQ